MNYQAYILIFTILNGFGIWIAWTNLAEQTYIMKQILRQLTKDKEQL